MIRKLDRVLHDGPGLFGTVVAVGLDIDRVQIAHVDVDDGKAPRVVKITDLTLLCYLPGCAREATCFARDDERAICHEHRIGWPIIQTRRDPEARDSCACGASLDVAKREGVWNLGDVACEYRTCINCHSTRAYMPNDARAGRKVQIYEDGRVAWEGTSLLAALEETPAREAVIQREGIVLARAVEAPAETAPSRFWFVLAPEKE